LFPVFPRQACDHSEVRSCAFCVQAGWVKNWNAGSWVGFMVLGPVLTAGVCTFVFMTRGMLWGFVVLGGLLVFDVLMYYFG